jgi:amidohydrolase
MGTQSAIQLRRDLHRHAELSGCEAGTAQRILRFFQPLEPDETLTELGGHGLAFGFGSADTGPSVLLRCELDALPITQTNGTAHRSVTEGVSHKCGHDGHMAILAAVGEALSRQRPARGRVVLLYQPAEETGAGASAVLADPRFAVIRPDLVFALHNLPGFPMGQILLRAETFTCASRGMEIRLTGRTAHAAQPETGRSPAKAMCRIIDELENLPARQEARSELAFATVVGARLGKKAFGTAPGDAAVMATLRSETDATMDRLVRDCEEMVRVIASAEQLGHTVSYEAG